MLFSSIPGLTSIKQTLIKGVQNNHVAHAQIFAGPEGSANLAMAIAYACYVNCENKQQLDSCGLCASCSKYLKLAHPDLHFVFPYSTTKLVPKDPTSGAFLKEWRSFLTNNPYQNLSQWGELIGSENKPLIIPVEEARHIIKTLSVKSFEARYKSMIIWLPETMRHEAANAILKILEEPPQKTLFLLVTHAIDKIIPTILSRTQKIIVPPFTQEEVYQYLKARYDADEKQLNNAAYLSEGNVNEAISILLQTEHEYRSMFRDWMRLCYMLYKKTSHLIDLNEWVETFSKLSKDNQKNFFQFGMHILREALVYKATGHQLIKLPPEDLSFVEKFSQVLNEYLIEKIAQKLNESAYHIERNANSKITFMHTTFYIASMFKTP
ncbi:MAG: DNA polymerase III subunit delta [Cytophagaceae bacterium]|nr:DNA polymerase III subunit delta [Cytophagaceae bacterium]MDW8455574.1 DNA polymerase III subunit delta [Cytophagaceae bacterium]